MRYHLISGLWIGLATAMKYNGCFLAIPYVYLTVKSGIETRRKMLFLIYAAGLALAFYSFLNPYTWLDFSFFMQEFRGEAAAHAGGLNLAHHLRYSLDHGVGMPILVLAAFGIIGAFRQNNFGRQAIALYVVGYYAVITV